MKDDFEVEFDDSTPSTNVVPFEDCQVDPKGLPYSENSERGVIAAVLLDPELFADCNGRLHAHVFFLLPHKVIWATMVHLYREHGMVDSVQVFEFLMSMPGSKLPALEKMLVAKQPLMEQIGGVEAFLQIQNAVEYVVDAGRLRVWIDRILHAYHCRKGVSIMGRAIERIKAGEPAVDVFSDSRWQLERLEQSSGEDLARPITQYKIPPKDDPSILLGENRYLCRGGQLIIAGPSSMGKSSMSIQMAICFALGRDFLGIPCPRPLKSLIVQAEDDDGDIAEPWESIRASMELTEDDLARVKKNVFIIQDKTHIGEQFITQLEGYIRRHKPDLVILNPLLSYVGGDLSKQEIAGNFLRNGLNRINKDDEWAYIIIHHTTKPSKDKSDKWQDQMYNMAGAAELVNWARAIIIVQPLEDEGHFVLNLAKRGKRAGVKEEDPDSPYGGWKYITKIPAQHATGTVKVDGRTLPRIEWLPSERAKQLRDAPSEKKSTGREQAVAWVDLEPYIPLGFEAAKKLAEINRNLIADGIIDAKQKRTVYRRIKEAEEAGTVIMRQDQKYYRKQK